MNYLKNAGLIIIAFSFMMLSCSKSHKVAGVESETMVVAFYNVENLFDTIDDPLKIDEDFTPGGKLHWNTERYETKLNRIAEVMQSLPGELPMFFGMCEIENKSVMVDLLKQPMFAEQSYSILHQDSPDERGIDAVAIYDAKRFKNVTSQFYSINLPTPNDPYTRDILYAQGQCDGETLHFFVNHWPSRSGGQAESEPNRIAVALLLRAKVDAIRKDQPSAKIIIMGDFNDHPVDVSIGKELGAGPAAADGLFNYMYDEHLAGAGSYFYKGEWGALDQFITTPSVLNDDRGWHAPADAAHVYKESKLLFLDKEGVARPNRTYAGDSYKAGYSDHLPIYMVLQK